MGIIVVGVDGSENAHRALAWAVGQAEATGDSVRVLHSWTFPAAAEGADGLPHVDFAAAASKVLDEAVASIGDATGVQIDTEIANDLAAQALIRESETADLVVVSSRGKGGFAGLLLGSVAQQVAQHARCPVVIVPATERT